MDNIVTYGLMTFAMTIGLVLIAVGIWVRSPAVRFEDLLGRFLCGVATRIRNEFARRRTVL
jgi:hypothetical protein